MGAQKIFILLILIGSQFIFDAAEETKNSTETNETPRLVQDSYIAALSNSRKGAIKSDRASVVYVTAANQEVKKLPQPVAKPTNSPPQPVVKINNVPLAKPTPVRREDNNYITGPNAEPNSYSAFTSNDGQSNYNGYTATGYDNSFYDSYLPQSNKYGPPKKYGVPGYDHAPLKPIYGSPDYTPSSSYGNSYGPPAPVYGAPLKPVYGVPYGAPSFFDKFKLKLDLLTLAKIILKIVIFKKIVKFIAIICLLLFIPKLIHIKKNGGDDDEERKLEFNAEGRTDQSLNTLYAFVQHAIDTYSQQQKGCEDVGCRMKNVLDKVNEEYTFSSMVDMFGGNEN